MNTPELNALIPLNLPPQYFKMCSVIWVEENLIQLEMTDWPVTIMAGGYNTNVSAGNKFSECFGLMSPNLRCVSQAADGPLRRLTNSKTINVPEITEFLPCFRTILSTVVNVPHY